MFYHHSVSPVHLYSFESVQFLFLVGPFCRTFVQLVAVLSFLTPATNAVYPQRIWLFFVGPGPFFLLVLRLSALGRNANLAGGFAGRRFGSLFVFVFWLVPLLVDYCTYTATVLCTFLAFTTSTAVRTEPQATSAAPEEKKNMSSVTLLYVADANNTIQESI